MKCSLCSVYAFSCPNTKTICLHNCGFYHSNPSVCVYCAVSLLVWSASSLWRTGRRLGEVCRIERHFCSCSNSEEEGDSSSTITLQTRRIGLICVTSLCNIVVSLFLFVLFSGGRHSCFLLFVCFTGVKKKVLLIFLFLFSPQSPLPSGLLRMQ